MYRLSKEFKFSMGHRLCLHKGLCKNFHGHNYKVIVGVKSKELDKNGMVIDFSNLKAVVTGFLDMLDHALMLNEKDDDSIEKVKEAFPGMKLIETPFEPTAENMAREIYIHIADALSIYKIKMDFVTVYETDEAQATFSED